MNNAAVNNPKFIILFFVEICLLALPSCRNDSTTGPGSQIGLSGPTVVIPVGLLKPQGIAVDAAGNIWVADTRQNRVRRFSPSGSATDSIVLNQPSRIALDKRTGDLLAVENATNVSRILLQTKTVLATFVLNPFSGDATAVFDINSRASTPTRVEVRDIGDIDTSPAGDIYIAARGTPANTVIRILNGNISAVAASTSDSATTVARFLAVDGYGTVFTSFSIPRGPASASIVYALTPGNITQSHTVAEPAVSAAACGAAIDGSGILYIADPATQEIILVSTVSERTLARHTIPDVNGFSMVPRDIAIASDGSVYVAVNDRLGTDAGAIIKYTRTSN